MRSALFQSSGMPPWSLWIFKNNRTVAQQQYQPLLLTPWGIFPPGPCIYVGWALAGHYWWVNMSVVVSAWSWELWSGSCHSAEQGGKKVLRTSVLPALSVTFFLACSSNGPFSSLGFCLTAALGYNARCTQKYVLYHHLLKPGGAVIFISSITHPR